MPRRGRRAVWGDGASGSAPAARPARVSRRIMLAAGILGSAAIASGHTRRAAARFLLSADGAEQPRPARARTLSGQAAPLSPAQRPPEDGAPPAPVFSDVAWVDADEALQFLAGGHPRYPGANLDSLMGFSPADILETMDTVVLDGVTARLGPEALGTLYRMIAREAVDALLGVYGDTPVVLALDAGHGGKHGVYFDPGSEGSEWLHTRRVVDAIENVVRDPRYGGITVRRIFNDDIGDDFGLPRPEDRKGAAALTIRNVRGAMLAAEAAAWNADHPHAPVAVHVLSVHFNAGSGGILVLHQGDAAPASFRDLSVAYARIYVASARPALNASGLLPYALRLALGAGLWDDRLLYEPPTRFANAINPYTGVDRSSFPRRYAMLQASLLERDYADGALRFRGLR